MYIYINAFTLIALDIEPLLDYVSTGQNMKSLASYCFWDFMTAIDFSN